MPERWLVREAVEFNALLRRPMVHGVTPEMMKPTIDLLLFALGLDHVADTPIGGPSVRGISGGQRRRVSLARGLASGCNLLFADEPTSGLSSTDAETCVKRLKLLSIKFGMAIVIVIHQPKPEVAGLFDKLILLTSQPGRCVYNGPMKDAFKFYETVGHPVPSYANPADHFLDMITPGVEMARPNAFVAFYQEHYAKAIDKEVDATIQAPGLTSEEVLRDKYDKISKVFHTSIDSPQKNLRYTTSFMFQLRVVFARTILLKMRDKQGLIIETVQAVVKAVILGIAFLGIGSQQPNFQLSFIFLLCQMSVISLLQNMGALIEGRTIMKYEVSDMLYRDEAYIISITVIDLTKFIINYIIYLVIAFAMAGLEWSLFTTFLGWSLLALLVMDSFFQMMGAVGATMADAQIKAMPFLILIMLFNGYFVTKSTVAEFMIWAIYISPLYYFIQAVAIASFSDTVAGQKMIQDYKFEQMTAISIIVLLSELAFFRILQIIFLKKLNNIER